MILFNHIPKTGGTTLRIILNRVYGIDNVFFIDSRNIKSSLEKFSSLTKAEQNKFKVIAGHGASMFSEYVENPFTITILREPVELFISQYLFLRISPGTLYFKDVSKIKRIEDYLDYAIEMGQDNLLTRYMSDSMQFLVNPDIPIPDFNKEGEKLLQKAISNLNEYDSVLNLGDFDKGVFALREKMNWNFIPIYRPSNINKIKSKHYEITTSLSNRINHALRFDNSLFNTFISNKLAISEGVKTKSLKYRLFSGRQFVLNSAAKLLGKS